MVKYINCSLLVVLNAIANTFLIVLIVNTLSIANTLY